MTEENETEYHIYNTCQGKSIEKMKNPEER